MLRGQKFKNSFFLSPSIENIKLLNLPKNQPPRSIGRVDMRVWSWKGLFLLNHQTESTWGIEICYVCLERASAVPYDGIDFSASSNPLIALKMWCFGRFSLPPQKKLLQFGQPAQFGSGLVSPYLRERPLRAQKCQNRPFLSQSLVFTFNRGFRYAFWRSNFPAPLNPFKAPRKWFF